MNDSTEALVAGALDLIDSAFSDEPPPSEVTDSLQLSEIEYEEVMSFDGMRWRDVTFARIERNCDAVFWFSPEAFCYFLPGIMAAGLRENRWDTNAYDSLIGMLDRGAMPDYRDDFFVPRWPRLSADQVEAVAAWARWLQAVEPEAFQSNTGERVHATLELLKRRPGAGTR